MYIKSSIYSDLYFKDEGDWHNISEWARYFIAVGEELAFAPRDDNRIITTMILPTRAFACAFIGLGIVLADETRQSQNTCEHFEKLFDSPVDTPVVYCHETGKRYKGRLRHPKDFNNELFVGVQIQNMDGGRLTEYIAESDAWRVQLADHAGKLPKKQGGRNVQVADQFISSFLGSADHAAEFSLRSKLACVLVGRKNILENEICRTPAMIGAKMNQSVEGKMQDILRVRSFASPNFQYRSTLLSIGPRPPATELLKNVEIATIFDGASGFLKWGSMWRRCHQVIVLDRSEPYLDDAVQEIKEKFSQDQSGGETSLPDCEPPPGVEVFAFRETN